MNEHVTWQWKQPTPHIKTLEGSDIRNAEALPNEKTATSAAPTPRAPSKKPLVASAAAAVVPTPQPAPRVSPPPSPPSDAGGTPPLAQIGSQTDDFASSVEEEILKLTNDERVKNGLMPLAEDPRLREIARAHSADMLAHGYFDHNDKNGCSSSCRASGAGYAWTVIGENIYMMSGYDLDTHASAKMVVDGWMNSPGHRKNILLESYTATGIGVALADGNVYVTADYAKPR